MGMLVALARNVKSSKLGKWAVKCAPQLLLGTGIVSGAGAIVSTGFATKKSIDDIEAEKMRRSIELNLPKEQITLTKKETVGLVWKNYLVPAGMATGSVAATVAAFKVEHGRALSLAALLGASESKLASMEAEMMEQLSDKKVKEIRDGAAQREIEKAKLDKPDSPIVDAGGSGEYWILDPASKLRTKGTMDRISLAIANADHTLELAAQNGYEDEKVSIADFLEDLGVDPCKIPTTMRNLVWVSGETTHIGVKVSYGHTENGEPCYVLEYGSIRPKWDDMWDISAY